MSKAELLLALVQALLSEFQDEVDPSDTEQESDEEDNPDDEAESSEEGDDDGSSDQLPGSNHIQQHYLKQSV